MAKRVTEEDINKINEVYSKCKSYAETARQTGWSASTVKRYVTMVAPSTENVNIIRFTKEQVPQFTEEILVQFAGLTNFGDLCNLSEKELEEMEIFKKELQS